MSSIHDGLGAALENQASEILRVGEALGPVTLTVDNRGDNDVILSVEKLSDGSHVALDDETAVTGEDTAYDGDTSETDFSGEDLNNTPVVPGTVTVKPTTGGSSVNATDKDGDGKLYTDDVDLDECGTIDYATGALVLSYPTGKEPNTTNITADYSYSGGATKPLGKSTKRLSNNPPEETFVVKAVGLGGPSQVRVEGHISF